ncbi:hypothetical protein FDECE_13909 [Fusarium decemcellulare]|nr:hypothetical protein FDECE_13909 [Fusarium decemcellulare]
MALDAQPVLFALFPKLPAEVRHLVWEHTLPGRQLHKAVRRRCPFQAAAVNMKRLPLSTHVLSPPSPIALRVCRESRAIARLHLTRFSRCQCSQGAPQGYFNPACDILFLDKRNIFSDWSAPWAPFRDFAMDIETVAGSQYYFIENPRILYLAAESRIRRIYLVILSYEPTSQWSRLETTTFIRQSDCVPLVELTPEDWPVSTQLCDKLKQLRDGNRPQALMASGVLRCHCPQPKPPTMKSKW